MKKQMSLLLVLVFVVAAVAGAAPSPQPDPYEQCWLAEIQAIDVYGNTVYYSEYVGTSSANCQSTIDGLIAFAAARGSTFIEGSDRCWASRWCYVM